jgi:hypothetical protein
MSRTALSLLVAFLLVVGLNTTPAHALNTLSFISGNGLDTNACTRTAPCRTLQKAHDSTNANGEINMLDPANYGVVTITKSISIVNDGVGSAGILVPSGADGITINAGASDKVNLRGLMIEGAGVGDKGIVFNTGASLSVQNSVIRNLLYGVQFMPVGASTMLSITNTLSTDNTNGVFVFLNSSVIVNGLLDHVLLERNGYGLFVEGLAASGGGINMTVVDTVVSSNGSGVLAMSDGAFVRLFLQRAAVVSNTFRGILSEGANAHVIVDRSSVFRNQYGWSARSGGLIYSYGNNAVHNNVADEGAQFMFTPL